MSTVLTFDLFSALLDSRTGVSRALGRLAADRAWPVDGGQVYDAWDRHNKAAQRDCPTWVPWREPASTALSRAYDDLGLVGDPTTDVEALVASLPDWPPWPDVTEGLPGSRRQGCVSGCSRTSTTSCSRARRSRRWSTPRRR